MLPTAISQLIEALCKLGIGLLMATYAAGQGYPLYVVAAYTVLGLTVGVSASMVFLGISKLFYREDLPAESIAVLSGEKKKSAGDIMRRIVLTAIPITLSASVTSFTNMIDGMIIAQRLQDIGYHVDMAATLFGNYKTLAVSLFNLPTSLIYPISYAVVPVLTEALEQKNRERGAFIMTSTFRTGAMIALPCSLGLAVMAKPILRLLFNDNSAEMAAPLLSVLSLSIFFVGMMTISNAVLQAYHFEKKPIVSMIAGSVVKLAASYVLIGIPLVGMYGAPLSTFACYVVITAINLYYMAKHIGFLPQIRAIMVRPLLASLLCAVSAAVIYRVLESWIGLTAAVLAAIVAAGVVYMLSVLVFHCLTKDDLLLLPYGTKMADILEKLHLM